MTYLPSSKYQIIPEGNNIRADKLDLKMFANIYEKSDKLQDTIEENKEKLQTINKLSEDIFDALFKYNVEMTPEEEIPEEYLFNRELVDKMTKLKEYRELREYTKLDNFSSAMGTISLVNKILEEIDDLDEINEQIEKIKELKAEKMFIEEKLKSKPKSKKLKAKLSKVNAEIGQTTNSMKGQLANMRREIRQALRNSLKAAKEDVDDAVSMAAGWGVEPGSIKKLPIDDKLKLANLLNNDKLKKIAKQLGKLRRLAQSKRQKITSVPNEVTSIELGNDLNRVLPIELAKLGNSKLKWLFMKDYLEKKLIEYEMKGKEKVGKGPIVACIDNSGSMKGDNEIWSKALALALLDIAMSNKQNMYVIHFGNSNEIQTFEFKPNDDTMSRIERIKEMAEFFFGGGTNFDRPLEEAFRLIERDETYNKCDIIFITDGDCEISNPDEIKEMKKKFDTQIQTILLGDGGGMDEVSDFIYTLDNILNKHKAVEVAGEIFENMR